MHVLDICHQVTPSLAQQPPRSRTRWQSFQSRRQDRNCAAPTGLGQGIALALAEAGADIAAAGIVEAAETGDKVRALGRRFLNLDANLISIEPVERLVKESIDGLGGLDILVNNAGLIRRADAVDFSEKDWDDVMNVNIKSAFFSVAGGRPALHRAGPRQDHQHRL